MATLDVFEFLDRIIALVRNENILNPSNDEKVVEYLDPQELLTKIDFSLTNTCQNLNELEGICKEVVKYSIKTNSKKFHIQLYGGMDLFGLGAVWLSESLNTNQYTFEVAPVFSLMERAIIDQVRNLVGYEQGDGIFTPGGSLSNMYGMVLARFSKFPQIKSKGLSNLPNLVAFTSEEGHYSLAKAAHWLGIGTDNLINVKTDNYGRLDVTELENEIIKCKEKGDLPFFVNGTVGTTVLGAIDPLDKLADICQKYQLWFHVDACYGGTLLLSKNYKQRLAASSRSDSFAWNPHKMLGAPLQCSIFITRHNNILHQCNSASATYLFQQDKFYDRSYDSGDKSIQCGRKVDCFKLWIMWKARGQTGFEILIDNAKDCADYFKSKIESVEGFRLVLDNFELTNVCFWYIPKNLRGLTEDENWWAKINKVAPRVKEKLVKRGHLMISYCPVRHKGLCNAFRMSVTCHPKLQYSDMDFIINEIIQISNNC